MNKRFRPKVKRYATFTTEVNGHAENRTMSYWQVMGRLFFAMFICYVAGWLIAAIGGYYSQP